MNFSRASTSSFASGHVLCSQAHDHVRQGRRRGGPDVARRVPRVPAARRDGGQLGALEPGVLRARAPPRPHARRPARRALSQGLPRPLLLLRPSSLMLLTRCFRCTRKC